MTVIYPKISWHHCNLSVQNYSKCWICWKNYWLSAEETR